MSNGAKPEFDVDLVLDEIAVHYPNVAEGLRAIKDASGVSLKIEAAVGGSSLRGDLVLSPLEVFRLVQSIVGTRVDGKWVRRES